MTYKDVLFEWENSNINNVYDLDAKLSNFRILFAYNSNVIENPQVTYHDTREIFENGKVSNYTGDTRTIFEIENQKICYENLKQNIIDKTPISPEFIRKVHKLLMKGCYDEQRWNKGERPGSFKKHDYITGDNIGCLAEDVNSEIAELCNEINEFNGKDKLIAAAYFHLTFESIHPFADGNGRVGRTLMNYYLMINNYPPLIIYNEDKQSYYMALAVFDKTSKLDGFIQFIKEETIKTWTIKEKKKSKLIDYVD